MLRKSLCVLLAFLLLVSLPLSGLAITQEEWDAAHYWQIAKDAKLYSLDGDREIGTIAKGTRVNFVTAGEDYATIEYLDENGEAVKARVLRKFLSNALSDLSYLFGTSGAVPTPKAMPTAKKESAVSTPTAVPQPEEETSYAETPANSVPVSAPEMEETLVAKATMNDDPVSVPEYEGTSAVINAPQSGKVTLRSGADKKAPPLGEYDAGMLVEVLGAEGDFSLVRCDGQQGYIRTNTLRFCEPAGEDAVPAIIVKDGIRDGSSKINIRLAADKDSWKVALLPTGTEVLMIAADEKWSEIEFDGFRGFILNQFLEPLL